MTARALPNLDSTWETVGPHLERWVALGWAFEFSKTEHVGSVEKWSIHFTDGGDCWDVAGTNLIDALLNAIARAEIENSKRIDEEAEWQRTQALSREPLPLETPAQYDRRLEGIARAQEAT